MGAVTVAVAKIEYRTNTLFWVPASVSFTYSMVTAADTDTGNQKRVFFIPQEKIMQPNTRTPFQRTFTGNPLILKFNRGQIFNPDSGKYELAAGGDVQIITNRSRVFKRLTLASTKRLIEIIERLGMDVVGAVEICTRYATEHPDPAPDVTQ